MKLKYYDFEIEGEASECAEFVRSLEGGCDGCRSVYREEKPNLELADATVKKVLAGAKRMLTPKKQRPYKNGFWKARLPSEYESIGEYINAQKERKFSAESIQLELMRFCNEHGDKIDYNLKGKINAIVKYYFKASD